MSLAPAPVLQAHGGGLDPPRASLRPRSSKPIGWVLTHHELHARLGLESWLRCFVVRSEEKELSVSPSGCPSHFSLGGQRKVTKRKATPRPRPLRIRAQRVRVSRSGFSDRPSLACRKPWPHPCGQPCGRIDRLPPLPRGPVEERGLLPARAQAKAKAKAKAKAGAESVVDSTPCDVRPSTQAHACRPAAWRRAEGEAQRRTLESRDRH